MKVTRAMKQRALDKVKGVSEDVWGLMAACWLDGHVAGWTAHLPWVMRHNKRLGLWEVGYYHSDRRWYLFKTFESPKAAEYHCHYLNGGV